MRLGEYMRRVDGGALQGAPITQTHGDDSSTSATDEGDGRARRIPFHRPVAKTIRRRSRRRRSLEIGGT
jgi:hypothetical protein